MIAALRRRHGRIWVALALLLPAVLLLALRERAVRPSDVVPVLAAPLLAAGGGAALAMASEAATSELLWQSARPFGELPLGAQVHESPDGALLLTLSPSAPLLEPDVLLYFVAAGSGDGPASTIDAGLPAQSVLLGAVPGTQVSSYRLPEAARAGGELRLYSLAHSRSLARAVLPPAGAPR